MLSRTLRIVYSVFMKLALAAAGVNNWWDGARIVVAD